MPSASRARRISASAYVGASATSSKSNPAPLLEALGGDRRPFLWKTRSGRGLVGVDGVKRALWASVILCRSSLIRWLDELSSASTRWRWSLVCFAFLQFSAFCLFLFFFLF